MDKIKKGGKRAGAGRKPSGKTKTPVTVYIEDTKIEGFGGLRKTREQIYCFINGTVPLPLDYVEVKNIGILQKDGTIKPIKYPRPLAAAEKTLKEIKQGELLEKQNKADPPLETKNQHGAPKRESNLIQQLRKEQSDESPQPKELSPYLKSLQEKKLK